jgi:CDP-diacylglycerol--glycerol-3-phosphate 3-phosphatidyltransferase
MLGNSKARDIGKLIATPFAKIFIKLGFSPDLVTLLGTIGVVVSSIIFFSKENFCGEQFCLPCLWALMQ